jgi:hypothetical protein
MSPFLAQIQDHFSSLSKNGREIVLRIKTWNNWENDLETEFGEKELNEFILGWVKRNTVNSSFNTTDASETFMLFEQVKIPLFNAANEPIDAREFTRGLQKYLKAAPFNITSKLMTRGLGEAILVLGEK